MRPRLLHLGYYRNGFARKHRTCCFNEAEAFTPRIRHRKFSDTIKARLLQ